MRTLLPFSPQQGENNCVSGIGKYDSPKNLALGHAMFNSTWCDKRKIRYHFCIWEVLWDGCRNC